VDDVALEISRNLYQYYAADTEIAHAVPETDGNVVFLGRLADPFLGDSKVEFPITISERFIVISTLSGKAWRYKAEPGMGAIFVRPLPDERLMLVLWGSDELGLRRAARLLPLRTGVGQPDFVIVDRETTWAGAAGALALGMFDSEWRVSMGSCL